MRGVARALWALILVAPALVACASARAPGGARERPIPAAARADNGVLGGAPRALDARALFADALARFESGDLEAAHERFEALLDTYPALVDYHLAFLATIDERAGRLRQAAAWDDRLIASNPESVWVPAALARRAHVAARLEDPAASQYVARALARSDTDPQARALALLVDGDLRAAESPRDAYLAYQETRRIGGAAADAARTRCVDLERAHPELLADHALLLSEGDVLIAERRLDLAAERLQAAAGSDTPATRSQALRRLARVRQLQGRIDDAVAAYREAAAVEPPPDGVAPYELATLLWNRDRDVEARALFDETLRQNPEHPKRDAMLYALGRIAEQEGQIGEALARYRDLATTGEDDDLRREALWRTAWLPYRSGDLAAAEHQLDVMAQVSTPDRPAALYWRARILERTGNTPAAREVYRQALVEAPEGYYAELSERRLGESPDPPAAPVPISGDPPPAILTRPYHWTRSQELHGAGLDRLAVRELDALARELAAATESELYLLEAYREVGAPARAIRLARTMEAAGTVPEPTLCGYLYPRPYWDIVASEASGARLDPYLVLALVRQESLFDSTAVSPAEAHGLMQLLVSTARRMADGPIDPPDLADPALNVRLGTRYLRQLLDRYDGDLARVLAAYNAGESAVAKWDERLPGAEDDEFVEGISFRETRKYVKAVLANYRRYRRLYGGPSEARALPTMTDPRRGD